MTAVQLKNDESVAAPLVTIDRCVNLRDSTMRQRETDRKRERRKVQARRPTDRLTPTQFSSTSPESEAGRHPQRLLQLHGCLLVADRQNWLS